MLSVLWMTTHSEHNQTYEIVCFGDSMLAQERGNTSVTNILAQEMGLRVLNGAFGGTKMAYFDKERSLFDTDDDFSMVALAQAAAYEDFSVQQTIRTRNVATEYFEATIDELTTVDFHKVELILVRHGVNDFQSGIPIENPQDPYDEYSFCGALRKTIECLREQLKDVRIILITPTFSWYKIEEEWMTCEEWNTGYGTLRDYVEAEHRVAKELGIEILDQFDLFPHGQGDEYIQYTLDGLHPNDAGRALIAASIAGYLKETKETSHMESLSKNAKSIVIDR
jgi:hypothetical protein